MSVLRNPNRGPCAVMICDAVRLAGCAKSRFASWLKCDSVHVFDSLGLGNAMRGADQRSEGIFSYVRLEQRVPAGHPLRAIRDLVDAALKDLSRDFSRLYARHGRPSIPPERLLRALLLQAFYTVRSERQLMEQLDYNLLFRWFVGLSMDDPVWDATVFCKNRDRLLDGDIAAKFFVTVLNQPQVRGLLSSEHFSVDGTLIEAWASMKSFVPKDGDDPPSGKRSGRSQGRNAERDFHGEKRKNDTHSSTTDPDARLFRKGAGKEAKLCHMGHLMMENRNGLIVDARLTDIALDRIGRRRICGQLKGSPDSYDVGEVREPKNIRPWCPELPVDQVERAWRCLVNHRRAHRFVADDALKSQVPHQPGHNAAGGIEAFTLHLPPHLTNLRTP